MTQKKAVRIHWKTQDNRHWFCCGAGEEFVQAAAKVVDADTLEALLPLVEVYARAQAAEELRDLASEIGWPDGRGMWRASDLIRERADKLIDPCRCPGEHCGDCGCCP